MPRARLALALVLVALVAAIEFWGGIRSGSLALLTDAVHVCMDVFALAVAFFALMGARRPANRRKTFGYGRIEMLGALLNGTVLLAATIFIVFQAEQRFFAPHRPEGLLMAIVAGAAWIDPALSIFVAAIIVVGVFRVLRDAADVLLEGTPRGLVLEEVQGRMAQIPGVVAVHDLHIWTIGTGAHALSAHVLIDDRRVSEATEILRRIDAAVRERFGVTHATLQMECENCQPGERTICTQTATRDGLPDCAKPAGL